MEYSFQYDSLPDQYIRIFKLDLDSTPEKLSGYLLSCYLPGQLDLTKRGMWKDFFGDTMQIMKTLSESSSYDAVSYTWGSPEAKHPLWLSSIRNSLVDGEVCLDHEPWRNGPICINSNLHTFLQELRRRRQKRFLWIDAICINQENQLEKSSQIPMMRAIYHTTPCILVWLGRASVEETMTMALLPNVLQALSKACLSDHILDVCRPESLSELGLPAPDHPFWRSLGSLMMRPWWFRVWTLQEVVLVLPYEDPDISIICGTSTIAWKDLDAFVSALRDPALRTWTIIGEYGVSVPESTGYDSMDQIRACRMSLDFAIATPTLLFSTRRRLATVPADHVFGIMGMMSKHTIEELGVETSMPTHSVFISFGKYYIRNETRECLLNHTSSKQHLAGLPSWCPNFASQEQTLSLGSCVSHFKIGESMYCAGFRSYGKWKRPEKKFSAVRGVINLLRLDRRPDEHRYNTNNPLQISVISGTDRLHVHGIGLDEVIAYVECNIGFNDGSTLSNDKIKLTQEWEAACLALALQTLEGKDPEVYARTLVADQRGADTRDTSNKAIDEQPLYRYENDYLDFKKNLQSITEGKRPSENRESPDSFAQYSTVLQRVARRRRFFATRAGRIGLSPADAKVGDVICILFYCPTPYLLRSSDREYLFVGEAYVHGLMYGEALSMLDEGKVNETSWVIK